MPVKGIVLDGFLELGRAAGGENQVLGGVGLVRKRLPIWCEDCDLVKFLGGVLAAKQRKQFA